MIILERVTKLAGIGREQRQVLSSVSMRIPTNRRIALLGPSDEDKKLFIDVLANMTLPTAGRVTRKVNVSFPVGDMSGFDADLSVRFNVAHVARLYGVNVKSTVGFVEEAAKLGPAFDMPYGKLDRDAKAELGKIVTYSIPFDVYLLNRDVEQTEKGLKRVSYALFEARVVRQPSGMIAAARNSTFVRKYCDMGLVLHNGKIHAFSDIEKALAMADQLRVVAR